MKQLIRDSIRVKNLLLEKVFIGQLDFPDKLKFSHFRVLLFLKDRGPAAFHTISESVKITKTNLSPVMACLEKIKYISFVPDTTDKRIKIASITIPGREFCIIKDEEIYSSLEERLLMFNNKERDMLSDGFKKIIKAFDGIGKKRKKIGKTT